MTRVDKNNNSIAHLLERIKTINKDKKDLIEKLKQSQFEIQEKNDKINNLSNINEQISKQIAELNTEKNNSESKNFWLYKNFIAQASSRNDIISHVMSLISQISPILEQNKLKYFTFGSSIKNILLVNS